MPPVLRIMAKQISHFIQNMLKKLLIFLVSIAFLSSVSAQDPVFSQFYANKMYLNPAFTGFHLGTVVNINYRRQWAGVREGYSKFETKSVGISTILPCYHSGFGLTYNEATKGEGFLKSQSAGFSYAYHYVNDNDRHNTSQLSLGFRTSYNWRSVNWENFVFGDQLVAMQGIVGPSQYTPPASMISQSKNYWDLDAGLVYMTEKWKVKRKVLAEDLRMGLAFSHLIKNNTSLLGYKEYLPIRYTAHISWLNELTNTQDAKHSVYLNPTARFDFQKASYSAAANSYMTISYGIGIMTPTLYGGFYLQNRNVIPERYNTSSLVAQLGYGWDTDNMFINFGMSKDFNLTGFSNYGGGAWEMSLIINPKNAMFCDPNSTSYKRRMQRQCKSM